MTREAAAISLEMTREAAAARDATASGGGGDVAQDATTATRNAMVGGAAHAWADSLTTMAPPYRRPEGGAEGPGAVPS